GDEADGLRGGVLVGDVVHEDRGASRREPLRDGAPDAPRGAGHHGGLAGEALVAHDASTSRASSIPGTSPTARQRSSGQRRLARLASTRPDPTSSARSGANDRSASIVASQRTGAVTCDTRRFTTSAASRTGLASTLVTTGMAGASTWMPPR